MLPSAGRGQLEVKEGDGDTRFCFYNANSHELVIPKGNYVSSSQRSNLTKSGTPSSATFVPKIDLPGCVADDGSPTLDYMDCILATAYNGAPAGCDSDMEETDCILNYIPAFCADLLESSTAAGIDVQDADAAMKACVRAVPSGPCVANPAGAACASGLFYVSSTAKRSGKLGQRQTANSIFTKEVWDNVAEQFVIGTTRPSIRRC